MMGTRNAACNWLLVVVAVYLCVGCANSRSPSTHENRKPVKETVEEAHSAEADVPSENDNNEEPQSDVQEGGPMTLKRRPNGCPLCDTSVYSYCSDKLLHDACCCLDPNDLPNECQFADCSFLHSNTCREHRLITACCCNQFLAHKK
ncbi:uncharacterized protein LOC126844497 [Adelges cooleyi]|uniref:uncharacterized protein LOC126844497 n=1 Tax=Adelges cooleyi TaxID=133065 RepID=UPI00218075E5|nr:uncharacterized protein LOC126844497 [Adelges cooleyi]